jgi:hypothetical protein
MCRPPPLDTSPVPGNLSLPHPYAAQSSQEGRFARSVMRSYNKVQAAQREAWMIENVVWSAGRDVRALLTSRMMEIQFERA